MVTLLLELTLPIVFILFSLVARLYIDIFRPSPRAFGSIIPKLCVVNSDEILRYKTHFEEKLKSGCHLRRELRRKQLRVFWTFVGEMLWNTRLFQQAVRFERMKIDPNKLSLDYEPRETLIVQLVDETADLRRQLVKRQARLIFNALFKSNLDGEALSFLLGAYKDLEHDILVLAEMGGEQTYYQMLIERLGLAEWGILEGGSAPA